MQAVITVVGKDKVGILAKISGICANLGVNVQEVTQNILGGTFAMLMLVDISKCSVEFNALAEMLSDGGKELEVDVTVTRQELFDAMHRI